MKKIITIILSFFVFSGTVVYAEAPNTSLSWGFKRGHDGIQADAGAHFDAIVKQYNAVYKDSSDEKNIYLTFDNGFENGNTVPILDVLKKQKVPATFFVTGHYLESAADLVKRMVKEGHIIGNHSWNHIDFTKVSEAKIKEEMDSVKTKTAELTGQKEMRYTRPPEGVFSERTLDITNKLGYKTIFWSVAFVDWDTKNQKGWQYAYDNIMKQIHPGAIILLHAVSKDNADALDKVITDLKKQGYHFKSLDELKVN